MSKKKKKVSPNHVPSLLAGAAPKHAASSPAKHEPKAPVAEAKQSKGGKRKAKHVGRAPEKADAARSASEARAAKHRKSPRDHAEKARKHKYSMSKAVHRDNPRPITLLLGGEERLREKIGSRIGDVTAAARDKSLPKADRERADEFLALRRASQEAT